MAFHCCQLREPGSGGRSSERCGQRLQSHRVMSGEKERDIYKYHAAPHMHPTSHALHNAILPHHAPALPQPEKQTRVHHLLSGPASSMDAPIINASEPVTMEVMRVTSSSNQEVMQKCLLNGINLRFGLGSPYIQTEKSFLIILNYIQ